MKSFATAGLGQPAALVAIGTAGALLLLGAGSAVAATHPEHPAAQQSPPAGQVTVPQGIGAAALHSAQVVGQAAATKKERVSFILNARNLGPLKALAASGGFARDLTVGQFAKTYGQPSANITTLVRYLKRYGITSHVLADHLDVSTTGTVADYNKALRVSQKTFRVGATPARRGHPGRPAATFAGTAQPATLPTRVGRFVLSVLGLTAYPAAISNAVHTPALPRGVRPAAVQEGKLTPADFARRYHLTPLLQAGHLGQGQTIGIVSLASMRASDATHFWSTTLKVQTKANRITLDNVDGGAGKISEAAGSGETTLDVEQSGALAPDASIDVYQAPNTDGGYIDGLATAASQDRAGAVSSSWGDSETFIDFNAAARKESASYARAFNEIFLEMAAQGQSSFIAAGDDGAYDAFGDQQSTNLSVDEPGSSPFTTDAGGTTLPGSIPVASGVTTTIGSERAWGWDWLWASWKKLGGSSEKSFAAENIAGGGGGFSTVEGTPFYQAHWLNVHRFSAVRYLTPTGTVRKDGVSLPMKWNFTGQPAVTTGTGTGRAVPDLSANADPYTGYEEYFTGFQGSPLEVGWGGTSFVAPQLAGTTAVINSALGRRVGFWNPAIYRFAARGGSPFTPLDQSGTGNDNLYYSGTKGNLFNAGTGLGTPDFAALAGDFAG